MSFQVDLDFDRIEKDILDPSHWNVHTITNSQLPNYNSKIWASVIYSHVKVDTQVLKSFVLLLNNKFNNAEIATLIIDPINVTFWNRGKSFSYSDLTIQLIAKYINLKDSFSLEYYNKQVYDFHNQILNICQKLREMLMININSSLTCSIDD